MKLRVNGESREISEDWRGETLLHVLREPLGLVGAKFGCGQGECGACTVWVDGEATRSCQVAAADVVDADITTVEGLAGADGALHPVQQAWLDEAVPQCGYCQAGQIMSAAALLRDNPNPTKAEIDAAMLGNLCRCGSYQRIRKAITRAAEVV